MFTAAMRACWRLQLEVSKLQVSTCLDNGVIQRLKLFTFSSTIISSCFVTFIYKLACSQSLNSSSGFIVSPLYPGYYNNNATCTWYLAAEENHVIRLQFQSFAVESHPACASDYVEVRDGSSHRSRTMGKYCGHTIPPIIESSSNVLTVVFSSSEANTRTGFKAYYYTKPGEVWIMFTVYILIRFCTLKKTF